MTEDFSRTHHWGELTRAEIAQARDAGALPVLTVGSVEQHGDHLPVLTDTLCAHRVATLAAERCAAPHVLVLPPPGFGFSPHHKDWAGTLTLSLETFVGLVGDVVESLRHTGFRRVLIVNGHGGNQGPLVSACTALASRGVEVGFVNYFGPGEKAWQEALPGKLRGVGHACAFETALVQALLPDEAARIAGRVAALPARMTPSYLAGEGPDPMKAAKGYWAAIFAAGDAGYVGDPQAATPEAGAAILEACVDGLARFYADFSAASFRTGAAV
jgi:creatinine amidohydrolase